MNNGASLKSKQQSQNMPWEDNLLIASWMHDPAYPQKPHEGKILFHNNETLLQRGNMTDHFSRTNPYMKNILVDRDIEFQCNKGNETEMNQDNLFILIDNDVKIFGVFDGHGINGHRVSSFACGKTFEYIRNLSNGFFRKKNLMDPKTKEKDIERQVKLCFKFV